MVGGFLVEVDCTQVFAYFLELGQFYGYITLKCNAIQHEDFRTSHKDCDIWR